MKYFLSIPLFLFCFQIRSQNIQPCEVKIEGIIYDRSDNKPIPFATIQVVGETKGTIADENGHFKITGLCGSEFDLMFSHIGYKEITHHHDPHHPFPNIYMAPNEMLLESVVVEGELEIGDLSSGTVGKLSAKELEISSSESLGDVIGNLSGVSVLKTGQNVVKPVIHGLHSSRILLINNGIRHESQSWGSEHAPEIDPSLADDISIIKGAATVRYGPEALGGVILIDPPKLELNTALEGEASVTGKTNGRSGEGTLQLQKGYKRLALLAEASYLRQGDLQAPDYNLSNTGKKEKSFALGARYHLSDVDFNIYYSHFSQELGVLRGSVIGNLDDLVKAIESEKPFYTTPFSYDINTPKQEVDHDFIKLNGTFNKNSHTLDLRYGFQINRRKEFDVRRGTNNEIPSIDLELKTHSLDLNWKHPEVNSWFGSVGIQGLYQDNNNIQGTNTVPFVPNYNNSRIGAYIIEAKELGATTVEAGLRYDYQFSSIRGRKPNNDIYRNDLNYQNVTATVGIRKDFQNKDIFRSNIGSAWRPPNISELYSYGKHQASIEYGLWRYTTNENNEISAGDIHTERDKAVNSEVGLKWINTYEINRNKLQGEITLYLNYIQNFIYTKPGGITQSIRGAFPFFLYDQADAVFTGADFGLRLIHSDKLVSQLKGSYLYAKNLDTDQNFVGLPPANLSYTIDSEFPGILFFSKTDLRFNLSYSFEQYNAPRVVSPRQILDAKSDGVDLFTNGNEIFDFTAPPPGFFLANVVWSGKINKFTTAVQIRNIFNSSYRIYTDRNRYFADDIGRNFIFSLKYQF